MIKRLFHYLWHAWPPFVILGAVLWYLFLFTPNVSVKSALTIEGDRFIFDNFSYKTLLGNTLCDKPSLLVITFEDSAGNRRNVTSNEKGYGSGDEKVRQWRSTGRIPQDLVEGRIVVIKRTVYPCIFGSVREVFSDQHAFMKL